MAGSNDVGWILTIFLIITFMGIFVPLMETELGFVSSTVNMTALTPGGSFNETAETGFSASPSTNVGLIFTGLGQAYFFTFPWMWTSGFFGILFGVFHIAIRLILIVLIYRLVRSGAG